MQLTLLDKYIGTCASNEKMMPVYANMSNALKEAPPVAHFWNYRGDTLSTPLPTEPVIWPDPAMCIYNPTGMTRGLHTFCVDVDYESEDFEPWFMKTQWTLEGLMLFQPAADMFDVIPLACETTRHELILAEMQLHFQLEDGVWNWTQSTTGPVNALFHNYFLEKMTVADHALVHDNVEQLGNIVSLYLGTYWEYLKQPGEWAISLARPPKLKVKNGEVKKVYKPGTAGYKEYQHTEETSIDENQDCNA